MNDTFNLSPESLASLVDASAAINDTGTLDETLNAIARAAAAVLRAEAASVVMLDETRKKQVFRAATGDRSDQIIGTEFDQGEGICGKVVATGQPAIVNDTSTNNDHYKDIDDQVGFITRSMIAAPLIYKNKPLGVIEIINPIDEKLFEEKDLQVVSIFANLSAIAIVNSKKSDRLAKDNSGLRQSLQSTGTMIGESKSLQGVDKLISQVAKSPVTVLLLGETGTGKEVTANKIHCESDRHDRPFVAVNCAALTPSLLESELFGHEAGSFTGAIGRKLGHFEIADGGTIFLDEIGELGMEIQTKLLRVLQEKEIVRVGGTSVISCDARIIAATNRDLATRVREGTFRDDLYYRLNVFPIKLPPLRDRGDDILLLAEHFLHQFASEIKMDLPSISKNASETIRSYSFPGNIRELRNIMERACLLCRSDDAGINNEIILDYLPSEVIDSAPDPGKPISSLLESNEKDMIIKALEDNSWNKSHAAKALKISRDNIRYRIKKYGIEQRV